MKYPIILISFILLFSIVSCTSNIKETDEQQNKSDDTVRVSYVYQDDEQTKSLRKRGAVIAKLSTNALGEALNKAIKESGAEHAINFCNLEAMKITDSLSKAEGALIRRVAKKYRNPKNETNPVESKIFKQYIMEWLNGVTLKSKIAINENGHPVFYKPIITNKKCLSCHGTPGETMPQNLADKIAALYPNDKAINFEDGHPRGMWAITFTEITVKTN